METKTKLQSKDTVAEHEASHPPLVIDTEITAHWVRKDMLEIVGLSADGTLIVSEGHRSDGAVDSVISRVKQFWPEYKKTTYVPLEQIIELRGSERKVTKAESDTIGYAREMIRDAYRRHASDIHIRVHDSKGYGEIRMRVDGLLTRLTDKNLKAKELAELCNVLYGVMPDVGNSHYNPSTYQSARIGYETGHLPAGLHGLRVESGPRLGGSGMVLRLLYDEKLQGNNLESRLVYFGYDPDQRRAIDVLTSHTDGITVISGPTGSGKTTTLFVVLSSIIDADQYLNVMTVEDPPELPIKDAEQVPVVTGDNAFERRDAFAKAIRHLLRSDPDVIMIGELRDAESAKLAIESAQTGHQVWTTLHANSAWKSMERLLDMFSGVGTEEIKPLIYDPDIVRGLVAQRLVRKLCPHCSLPIRGNDNEIPKALLGRMLKVITMSGGKLDNIRVRGPGCKACSTGKDSHGYKGRTVVAEVVQTSYEMMEYAKENGVGEAEREWRRRGGVSMMRHGIIKLMRGEIDAQNLESVLGPLHLDDIAPQAVAARG